MYTADIQHVPGVENVVAVVAVVLPASTGMLNWAQLATGQATCGDLAAIRARRPHHLVAVQVEGFPVCCDVSTGVWRPLVPLEFRQQVFDTVHGLVHPGVRATTCLVSNRFVWPGLASGHGHQGVVQAVCGLLPGQGDPRGAGGGGEDPYPRIHRQTSERQTSENHKILYLFKNATASQTSVADKFC